MAQNVQKRRNNTRKNNQKKSCVQVNRAARPKNSSAKTEEDERRQHEKKTEQRAKTTREERGERPTSSYPTRPTSPLLGWYALCIDNTPRNASKRGVVAACGITGKFLRRRRALAGRKIFLSLITFLGCQTGPGEDR